MSLLLEALKKAELAKQRSKLAATVTSTLELAPSAGPPEKSIITREHLPEITPELEILSKDLPSSASSKASTEIAATRMAAEPEPMFANEPVQDQAAAKQLFEAKGLEDYNPRKPFYYTVGALSVFAVGTVFYFWWQLQPRYAEVPMAIADAPAQQAGLITPPPAAAPPAIDPLSSPPPGVAPAPGSQGPGVATKQVKAGTPTPPGTPARATAAPAPAALSPANSPLVITRSTPSGAQGVLAIPRAKTPGSARAPVPPALMSAAARTDQQLERAYDAYQKGDLATARQYYLDSAKIDPSNRDALLGLAAIDLRSGQLEGAAARYMKLLEADPRDTHALAGLIALRGQADPIQSESRLKNMLASHPEAGFLHFTLGNQMAAQARWPEAQEAYFKAAAIEPDSPDYAYNLAVSLDHMRQSKPALEYYQKALTLGSARPATFDRALATARMRELQQ